MSEYPQELLEENQQLSILVEELIHRFRGGIVIHIIDPQSLRGAFKSLKYRVRRYPAFIIDGKELIIGWNRAALNSAIETRTSG